MQDGREGHHPVVLVVALMLGWAVRASAFVPFPHFHQILSSVFQGWHRCWRRLHCGHSGVAHEKMSAHVHYSLKASESHELCDWQLKSHLCHEMVAMIMSSKSVLGAGISSNLDMLQGLGFF